MSSTLTVEPAKRKKQVLNYELKSCLQKRNGGCTFHSLMTESDIPYLKGLVDAGIEDAQIVIDFIEKYEEVVLNEEF